MSKPKPNELAGCYLGIGALEYRMGKDKPSPADHDLDGCVLTLTFPARCSVVRPHGTAGDDYKTPAGTLVKGMPGFNKPREEHAPDLSLDVSMCLIFMKLAGVDLGQGSSQQWLAAVREALEMEGKIDKNIPAPKRAAILNAMIEQLIPSTAREALTTVAAAMPKVKPEAKPTSCSRCGEKEVLITLTRPRAQTKKLAKA